MRRGLLLRDAGTETFEADRCGERVVRNAVGPAEGVRPDSIFPLPKGLRSVKCWAVRSGRLVLCEKAASGPASMLFGRKEKVCRTTWRETYSAVESRFGCGRSIEKPISRSARPIRQESDRPTGEDAQTAESRGVGPSFRIVRAAFRAGRSPYSVSATTRTIARASVSSS